MKSGMVKLGFTPLETMVVRKSVQDNKSFLTGFTLIEIIITVAVIVILVSMMVGITKRIDDQNKERLCRNELALIDNALEQFRDFGFEYKNGYATLGLNFPLDCNNFSDVQLGYTIQLSLNLPIPSINPVAPCQIENSGSEGLYFFLSQIPDCRTTLDKIDKSLVTNLNKNHVPMTITIGGRVIPLMRFIDPWGMTLHYDYYDDRYIELPPPTYPSPNTKKTFPVITSAGADKRFGTDDDIVNRQGK
jgi:prepilin-type N-terminal cleavage/methylation domain-containing protein